LLTGVGLVVDVPLVGGAASGQCSIVIAVHPAEFGRAT
jgi:hypothetical protein